MKTHYTLKEQWEFVKPIWRIMLAVLLVQLVAGLTSIVIGRYEHPFLDFWFGGAVSTFPGFILGLLWQTYSSKETIKNNLLAIGFIGSLCLIVTSAAFFMPLEQFSLALQRITLF